MKAAAINPTSKQVTSAEKKRDPKIYILDLSPTRGWLKIRLNHEIRTHMTAVPLLENPVCQLHWWAHKEFNPLEKKEGVSVKPSGSRLHVMQCNTCGVNLCLHCWEIFHSQSRLKLHVPDILAKKIDVLSRAPIGQRIRHVITYLYGIYSTILLHLIPQKGQLSTN